MILRLILVCFKRLASEEVSEDLFHDDDDDDENNAEIVSVKPQERQKVSSWSNCQNKKLSYENKTYNCNHTFQFFTHLSMSLKRFLSMNQKEFQYWNSQALQAILESNK